MKINLTLLENVDLKEGGRTVARCPACAALGGDKKGNNLVVYPDGKFGCIAFSNDKAHNKRILQKVGFKSSGSDYRFKVEPLRFPESQVLLRIGKLARSRKPEIPHDNGPTQQE